MLSAEKAQTPKSLTRYSRESPSFALGVLQCAIKKEIFVSTKGCKTTLKLNLNCRSKKTAKNDQIMASKMIEIYERKSPYKTRNQREIVTYG